MIVFLFRHPWQALCTARRLTTHREAEDIDAADGGLLVVWLGGQAVREARTAALSPTPTADPHLTRKGILVNMLNPHPWLFWISVGGPILLSAWRTAPTDALVFLVTVYALIVGTKAAVAGLIATSRSRLNLAWYRRLLGASGLLLLLTGVVLAAEFVGQLS